MKTVSIVLSCLCLFLRLSTAQETTAVPNKRIFEMRTLASTGQEFFCQSFEKNKASVLVFISESCPICQKYTPTLKQLWSEFSGKNIGFYGVFPSTSVEIDSVKEFSEKYKIPFPLLIDSNQSITSCLKATVTPEVVVLSRVGEVLYRGRIDNLFPVIGRKRYAATTHELRDALIAIVRGAVIQVKQTEPVGCFIETDR